MALVEDEKKKTNTVINNNKKKKSKGRQKIDIKKIEKADQRQVTFSKRRTGLFKKAGELSVLTGSEVGIIVFSEGNKPYTFGHPNINTVVDEYLNDRGKRSASSSNTSSSLDHNNVVRNVVPSKKKYGHGRPYGDLNEMSKSYLEAANKLEEEKRKVKLEAATETKKGPESGIDNDGMFLWDENVEKMSSLEELEEYLTALQEMKANIVNVLDMSKERGDCVQG